MMGGSAGESGSDTEPSSRLRTAGFNHIWERRCCSLTTKAAGLQVGAPVARVHTASPGVGLICVEHTAQNLALPVGRVHRPALHGDTVSPHDLGPAANVDVPLALAFCGQQLAGNARAVASPPADVVVVDYRDDARLGQVEEAQGDYLVARRFVALLELQEIAVDGFRVGDEPAAWHQQAIREQVGQRLAGHGLRLARFDSQPLEQLALEVFANLVSDSPLVPFLG